MPGDGQNRPSVGESLIQVQERYNTLSNIQAETYEYGIPPIYADPQVLDFDALAGQTAEPAAHYPARARPGMALADGFYQPLPAQVPPDMLRHQQDLAGPIAQFLTGLFPAIFGGEMPGVKTATGYAMARDQALGRLGLVWRRLKVFYADMMLLGVDCFRKNRPSDVEIPFLGDGGQFQARFIRLADLRGNIQTHAEADETFPRVKSQQRAVLQQLMSNPDPTVQATLREPANLGFIKSLIGLNELVVPGEDARTKQLREIQQLLAAAPIATHGVVAQVFGASPAPGPEAFAGGDSEATASGPRPTLRDGRPELQPTVSAPDAIHLISTVPVDELLDDHASEFEECRRWASSDAGQLARAQNPAGFANVRAHAAEHAAALARLQAKPVVFPPPSRPRPNQLRTYATDAADSDTSSDDESEGSQNSSVPQPRQTPQSLAAQIPADVRAEMARAIDDSNRPTTDDKKGGFHEESGIAGPDASGNWKVAREVSGPYGDPGNSTHLTASKVPLNADEWQSIDPKVVFHVHPAGQTLHPRPDGTTETRVWNQPPSDDDKKDAPNPEDLPADRSIIVFAAREKKVYFYDKSGVTGTMSLKDFLRQ